MKRIHEELNFQLPLVPVDNRVELDGMHFNGPLGGFSDTEVDQYSKVSFNGRMFKLDNRNDAVFYRNSYGVIVNILKKDNHIIFLVNRFEWLRDVFESPCESSKVGIVFAKSRSPNCTAVHIREIAKCWCVEWCDGKYYIAKLLHDSR